MQMFIQTNPETNEVLYLTTVTEFLPEEILSKGKMIDTEMPVMPKINDNQIMTFKYDDQSNTLFYDVTERQVIPPTDAQELETLRLENIQLKQQLEILKANTTI